MTRSPRPRKATRISDSLERHLNMYALAAVGAAGVGTLALAQPAQAKVVYTPTHVRVGPALPLDLNHDGIVDFYLNVFGRDRTEQLSACQYWWKSGSGSVIGCSYSHGTNAIRTIDSNSRVFGAALRYGAKIQSGEQFAKPKAILGKLDTWGGPTYSWFGPWLNGGKGVQHRYLGLKFKIKGRFHFGWARITVTTTTRQFTATLTGYAYETVPNKAIIAGKITGADVVTLPPDAAPGSLGNLALGRK